MRRAWQDATLGDILSKAKVTLEDYVKALAMSRSGREVILKRKPSERHVNGYSPCILKGWRANMDIQYVVNAYACLMYIASYIMKAEKGMSELLKNLARELESELLATQLNKLGTVFLRNREISAQEAAYRALSLQLRKFSRKVIFVNTGDKQHRTGMLKSRRQLEELDDEDDDVYCKNMIDRYALRPPSVEDLCLADFVRYYTY